MKPSEVIKLEAQQNGLDPRAALIAVQKIVQFGEFWWVHFFNLHFAFY